MYIIDPANIEHRPDGTVSREVAAGLGYTQIKVLQAWFDASVCREGPMSEVEKMPSPDAFDSASKLVRALSVKGDDGFMGKFERNDEGGIYIEVWFNLCEQFVVSQQLAAYTRVVRVCAHGGVVERVLVRTGNTWRDRKRLRRIEHAGLRFGRRLGPSADLCAA